MRRILLVDDESDFTEIIATFLKRHGFEVEEVNDSALAIERMERGTFDGFVLDLMMLPVGGLELLRHLRGLERHAATPVWILSAKRMSDEERKELLEFKVQLVTKPVALKVLLQAIKRKLP